MSHTPGPWTYEVHELSEGFSGIVYDPNGYRIGTDHLTEADARLIAAAPTMYEFVASKAESGDNEAILIMETINGNAKGNKAMERRNR